MALRLIFALAALCAAAAFHPGPHDPPPWQAPSAWPDRINATVTRDPQTSFAVTWRTEAGVSRTQAQIAPAANHARFELGALTVAAVTETLALDRFPTPQGVNLAPDNQGLSPVSYHSVVFEDLAPDTLYAYRVRGGEGLWSEWFQIRTAPAEGPVSFVYFGDAQNGIRSHWSRIIRSAYAAAPHASFILHAGDLVDQGHRDLDWAEWFEAGQFVHAMIPLMPVAGNHEQQAASGAETCACGYDSEEDERISCMAFEYALESLSEANREWLGTWPDRDRLAEELDERVGHDGADAVDVDEFPVGLGVSLRGPPRRRPQGREVVEMARQQLRAGLADMRDAEREDEAVERDGTPLGYRGEEVADARRAPAFTGLEAVEPFCIVSLQPEDVLR